MPKYLHFFRRTDRIGKETGDHISEIERIERVFACNLSKQVCACHEIAPVLLDELVRLLHGRRSDRRIFDGHIEREEHVEVIRKDMENVLGEERVLGRNVHRMKQLREEEIEFASSEWAGRGSASVSNE